jgi:hypothetical protein
MATKQEWGNACWYLFHSLSFKLKDGQDHIIIELMALCRNIAIILPCPDCSEHAKQSFALADRSGVRVADRAGFQRFWWQFHNLVNARLKKPSITFEDAQDKYSKSRLFNIVKHFMNIFGRNVPGERNMMYTMSRRNAIKKMYDFIKANQVSFELN